MSGVVWGAAAMIVASAGRSNAGGPDSGTGDRRGASSADELCGPVGEECATGCGDRSGTCGTASVVVAGAASGVVGNEVAALVSASAVLRPVPQVGKRCRGIRHARFGRREIADVLANAENSSSRVLGSHSSSGVLRTAQALGLSWGYASGVKGALPWLRHVGRLKDANWR